jgi:hypothetical protein
MDMPTISDTTAFVKNACGYLGLSPHDQAVAALAATVALALDAEIPEDQLHAWIAEGYAAARAKRASESN